MKKPSLLEPIAFTVFSHAQIVLFMLSTERGWVWPIYGLLCLLALYAMVRTWKRYVVDAQRAARLEYDERLYALESRVTDRVEQLLKVQTQIKAEKRRNNVVPIREKN